MSKIAPWWGRTGSVAHYFPKIIPNRSGSMTLCGRVCDLMSIRPPWTRLHTETGEPLPHCSQCESKLAAQPESDGEPK